MDETQSLCEIATVVMGYVLSFQGWVGCQIRNGMKCLAVLGALPGPEVVSGILLKLSTRCHLHPMAHPARTGCKLLSLKIQALPVGVMSLSKN